jgi:hypothetical protein
MFSWWSDWRSQPGFTGLLLLLSTKQERIRESYALTYGMNIDAVVQDCHSHNT